MFRSQFALFPPIVFGSAQFSPIVSSVQHSFTVFFDLDQIHSFLLRFLEVSTVCWQYLSFSPEELSRTTVTV